MILYDNVHGAGRSHLDEYAIKVGMYGLEQVVFVPAMDGSVRARFVDIVFGPKKKDWSRAQQGAQCGGRLYQDEADSIGLDLFYQRVRNGPVQAIASRRIGGALRPAVEPSTQGFLRAPDRGGETKKVALSACARKLAHKSQCDGPEQYAVDDARRPNSIQLLTACAASLKVAAR